MRKYQQRQILELIGTLDEGCTEMEQLFSCGNISVLLQLMSDSQDFVDHIVAYIEQVESTASKTVELLRSYYKALYQLAQAVSDSSTDRGNSLFQPLIEQLGNIRACADAEFQPDRFEIVFLPYKASMWDSFESVWLAAQNDDRCIVRVIPIPYFERLADGSAGKMIYEGLQYPLDVPVVDYRSYHMEAQHPDAIFVHNPYDGANYVTSVHPDYYSEKLKAYTDTLCYIPYFVVSGDVPEHFCICAGTLYADRVFLQDEKVRQTYVQAFRKFEQDNNCCGKFGNLEEKFVASGSPKFDKTINASLDEFHLPAEWEQRAFCPDGTKRFTVVYNTSVTAILQGNEQYLQKLRQVISFFSTRKEVLFWWRPHPLSKDTLQSMRPQLLKAYEEIVANFQNESWGIYDESSDLHRALAFADAYYGDASSLVAMCEAVSKPVLIQNIYQHSGRSGLEIQAFDLQGDYAWFTSQNVSGLFKMDMRTGATERLADFGTEKGAHLYARSVRNDGKIYFAPHYAAQIAAYDPQQDQLTFTQIEHKDRAVWLSEGVRGNFNAVYSYAQFVFFAAQNYPEIIKYDTRDGSLTYYADWVRELENELPRDEAGVLQKSSGTFTCSWRASNSEFVLICCDSNRLLFFDMETCKHRWVRIGRPEERFSYGCFDGRDYWLPAKNRSYLLRWNPKTKREKRIPLPEDVSAGAALNFVDPIVYGGYLYLFPLQANAALRIRIQDEKCECLSEFEPFAETLGTKFDMAVADGEQIILLFHDSVVKYNPRTRTIQIVDLQIPEHLKRPLLESQTDALHSAPVWEEHGFEIETFLNQIEQINAKAEALKVAHSGNLNYDGKSGSRIYQQIKEERWGAGQW